jgi:hypothetical protein
MEKAAQQMEQERPYAGAPRPTGADKRQALVEGWKQRFYSNPFAFLCGYLSLLASWRAMARQSGCRRAH